MRDGRVETIQHCVVETRQCPRLHALAQTGRARTILGKIRTKKGKRKGEEEAMKGIKPVNEHRRYKVLRVARRREELGRTDELKRRRLAK